jgi:hypothetical protein
MQIKQSSICASQAPRLIRTLVTARYRINLLGYTESFAIAVAGQCATCQRGIISIVSCVISIQAVYPAFILLCTSFRRYNNHPRHSRDIAGFLHTGAMLLSTAATEQLQSSSYVQPRRRPLDSSKGTAITIRLGSFLHASCIYKSSCKALQSGRAAAQGPSTCHKDTAARLFSSAP